MNGNNRIRVNIGDTTMSEAIGARVRLRRRLLGRSMEQVAGEMGISYQQLQKLERGTNRFTADSLYLLSNILNVPITFFFDDMDGAPLTAHAGDDGQLKRRHLEMCRMFDQMDEALQQRLYGLMKAMAKEGASAAQAA